MASGLLMVVGVCRAFSFSPLCFARRRAVSPIAALMDAVTVSAYSKTFPPALRAARPNVWISDPVDRKKTFLSASG